MFFLYLLSNYHQHGMIVRGTLGQNLSKVLKSFMMLTITRMCDVIKQFSVSFKAPLSFAQFG